MTRRYTGGFLSATEQATDSTSANGVFTVSEAQQLTAAGTFPSGDFIPQRSLRFKATGSTKLYRTIASTGSQTKATVSVWFKRAKVTNQTGARQEIFSHKISTAGSNSLTISLDNTTDRMQLLVADTGNNNYSITTTQVFRDTSAWYHLVYAIDSTQAIAAERMRVWINGQRVTSFASTSYPSQNASLRLSDSSLHHTWGVDPRDNTYLEGYLSEAYFIDGQSYDASYFGRTHAQTGVWVPKAFTGTYGTNGSYLNFSDVSSTTSNSNVGIGKDYSGNGNYFISSNVTLSGGDYWDWDQMYDVPGLPSQTPGKQNRGNYPIMNFNHKHADITSTQAAQYVYNNTSAAYRCAWFTTVIPPAGKYYWEVTLQGAGDVMGFGIAPTSKASESDSLNANFVNQEGKTPGFYTNWQGAAAGYLADGASDYISVTTNDVINFAYDAENGNLWIGKNGVYYTANGVSTPHVTTNAGIGRPSRTVEPKWRQEGMVPYFMAYSGTGTGVRGAIFNFGQKDYRYTPPAGFNTLCTTSMPSPTIKRPKDQFDVKAYTGTGAPLQVGNTAKPSTAIQTKSVRLRRSASATLTRQYTTSPTSRTTYTISAWVKPTLTTSSTIAVWGTAGNWESLRWYTDGTIYWCPGSGKTWTTNYTISAGNWYHVMVAVDTTQLNPLARGKLYINGVQITNYSSQDTVTQNAQTVEWGVPSASSSVIGATGGYGIANTFDGQISEFYYIDGSAKSPTDFGQYDANNNWVPKTYTGSYGNNGSYLPMTPPSLGTQTYGVKWDAVSAQYLRASSATAFDIGSGTDYTFETWVYFGSYTTDGNVRYIFDATSTGASGGSQIFLAQEANGTWTVAGLSGSAIPADYFTTNTWYHVAVSRASGTVRVFVNGVLTNSAADTTAIDTDSFTIGARYSNNYTLHAGAILSNVRFIVGTGLYTTNFTPPTTTLTAVANTKLLTCQSSTIIDNSANNFTVNNYGSVAAPIVAYPFSAPPTYSALFADGSGDYLTVPASSALQFGTGDFTIEFWAWLEPYNAFNGSASYWATIFGACVGSSDSNSITNTVGIWQGDGTGTSTVGGEYTVIIPAPDVANQKRLHSGVSGWYRWSHVALTRSSGTFTLWQDGIARASVTVSADINRNDYSVIGKSINSGIKGNISNLRVVKGVAVYTGTFTPPTAALTATQSAGTNIAAITAGQCSLLTLQSSGFRDNSSNAFTISRYGNTYMTPNTVPPTSSGVGKDNSGNNNNWGTRNIDQTTATVTYDALTDTPTEYVDSSSVINANYAVLNNMDKGSVVTVSNGGLGWAQSTTTAQAIRATLPMPYGKWYWELSAASNNSPGILKQSGSISTYVGGDSKGWSYFIDGTLYNSGSNSSFGATHGSADTISIAFDADSGKLWFAKNGVWQGSGDPAAGTNPAVVAPTDPNDLWYPAMSTSVTGAVVGNVNFGQRPFIYNIPSGFKTLNTKNLKEVGGYMLPDNFGNFANTPDLVWVKSRSETYNHILQDTTRGVAQYFDTTLSGTQGVTTALQSFTPNGFTIGSIAGGNKLANNHVAMAWNKGKIPGFDIVPFQGAGAVTQIPHNLGQVPKFIMTKGITNSTAWALYHAGIGPLSAIYMHTTAGINTGADWWNNTAPTSTHFTLGANFPSTYSFMAYLWAEVPGFSRFGTYYGNGSTTGDGPYVYTGFRPRFIMFKSMSGVTDWHMHDTARDPINPCGRILYPNTSGAEGVGSGYFDILSNGFKVKTDAGGYNASGSTYMYVAFAENPFKYANAR